MRNETSFQRPSPEGDLEDVTLAEEGLSKTNRMGASIKSELKEEISKVLKTNADIFAWSPADMPSIDRSIICHELPTDGRLPIRQKKRAFGAERHEPEMTTNHWVLYVDGSAGRKGSGVGVTILTPEGELPEEDPARKKMLKISPRFCVDSGILYKRGFLQPMLKCLGLTPGRGNALERDQNDEALRINLDLLEEKRETTAIKIAAYKQKVARYRNRRVKKRTLEKGDLVLKWTDRPKGQDGKLKAIWEGPYRVREAIPSGAYRLETIEGQEVPRTWNMEKLKKYYL
ncbi:hypothetical protein G2W53_014077 [Senna tora]|uniref:Uncharacterized protein n=1 Tax=Senna tora TaxID=362788 RepID=A0A834U0Q4_9FABA|nr:hypothetical protein G2W53_014077 [Senna tora]